LPIGPTRTLGEGANPHPTYGPDLCLSFRERRLTGERRRWTRKRLQTTEASVFWYHRGMADAALARSFAFRTRAPRHHAVVRVTHWLTALCFLALGITGAHIVTSHPRFYWGETGNVMTPALFELPIPASRSYVNTGYDYVLPDQNGWSRSLHFQAAWLIVFTGLLYSVFGLWTHHFLHDLAPSRTEITASALRKAIAAHLRRKLPEQASYNVLQRIAYMSVVFVLFPLMIWTGLAMSPAVVSVFPGIVTVFGGHQSARTIHFVVSLLLLVFVLVHFVMVFRAGFRAHVGAMITGRET
jgi:thiosulfate reductase cytochrome b subunit